MFTLAAAETIAGIAGTATAITYALFGMELSAAGVETYKKLAQGQLATGAAAIYTTPASTTTFVKSIHLANATASDVTGVALYSKGTAAANRVTGSFTIPANGWAICEEDGWRVYDGNGVLQTGVPSGLRYKFNSSTSAADPGDGKFGFNNNLTSGLLSITAMYISRKMLEGTVVGTLLDAMVGQAVKCALIFRSTDGSKIISMIASGVYVDNTTYYTVTISSPLLASSGIANGQDFFLNMFRYGADGQGVPTGGSNGQWLKKLSGTNFDTAWAALPARNPILTADVDLYVRRDGSDSNTGTTNTAGGAFLTKQKAMDVISLIYDNGGFTVFVHVNDDGGSPYTGGVNVRTWVGGGIIHFIGNTTTPGNCKITVTGGNIFDASFGVIPGIVRFTGFQLKTITSGFPMVSRSPGRFQYSNIFFDASPLVHVVCTGSGLIEPYGTNTILGSASLGHMLTDVGGTINNTAADLPTAAGVTTVTGPLTFGNFARAIGASRIAINLGSYSISGVITSARYNVSANSLIQRNADDLPGASAGTTATGGQYI
jgi:hypothetical protein